MKLLNCTLPVVVAIASFLLGIYLVEQSQSHGFREVILGGAFCSLLGLGAYFGTLATGGLILAMLFNPDIGLFPKTLISKSLKSKDLS